SVGVVAEQDGADSAFALGHEDRAERAFAYREPNVSGRSAGAIARGGHSEHLVGRRVEAAVGVVAGFVDGFGDGGSPIERLAHAIVAMSGGVVLRREAGRL